jgi:hypothetical protein
MKGRLQALLFGLSVAAAIRIGLALWKGSGRVEALLIVIVTFAVLGFFYFIFYRDGKVNS